MKKKSAALLTALLMVLSAASYEDLCAYPHLKAKLDYMADWIKPYFGYVYFEP
ncbi:MAG: hypothetical protein IKP95_01970 [Ruminococcus sp.]|nr:hypothetical protein [Ruminococcus sp.]